MVQEQLDRLLGVTETDRANLSQGQIPAALLKQHEYIKPGLIQRAAEAVENRFKPSSRPELLTVCGEVRTRRTWNYSYGDVYELWTEISVNAVVGGHAYRSTASECWFNLFGRLERSVLSGTATLYVIRFPTTRKEFAPHVDIVAAIEVGNQTTFCEREPSVREPAEPYMGGQPADGGTLS